MDELEPSDPGEDHDTDDYSEGSTCSRGHVHRQNRQHVYDFSDEELDDDDEPPLEPRDVKINRVHRVDSVYDLLEILGKGKFGVVYKCMEKSSSRHFAAKFIDIKHPQERRDVETEIELMNDLRHPRLLQLHDAFDDGKRMTIIMELATGGELFSRVIDEEFVLTEKVCTVFMRQICEGVEYMHSKNVVHLDMKPENVLCVTPTGNRIKLIDFGLARRYSAKDSIRVMFGTPEFVAPEVINYDCISLATDMWSVGVICYILLSGLSPFMGDNDAETLSNVTNAAWDFEDECFDAISDDAKDFITQLLVRRPEKRITATQCLKHIWLKQSRRRSSILDPEDKGLSKAKLRRFVIRRRWQKVFNTIRALRRMGSFRLDSTNHQGDTRDRSEPMDLVLAAGGIPDVVEEIPEEPSDITTEDAEDNSEETVPKKVPDTRTVLEDPLPKADTFVRQDEPGENESLAETATNEAELRGRPSASQIQTVTEVRNLAEQEGIDRASPAKTALASVETDSDSVTGFPREPTSNRVSLSLDTDDMTGTVVNDQENRTFRVLQNQARDSLSPETESSLASSPEYKKQGFFRESPPATSSSEFSSSRMKNGTSNGFRSERQDSGSPETKRSSASEDQNYIDRSPKEATPDSTNDVSETNISRLSSETSQETSRLTDHQSEKRNSFSPEVEKPPFPHHRKLSSSSKESTPDLGDRTSGIRSSSVTSELDQGSLGLQCTKNSQGRSPEAKKSPTPELQQQKSTQFLDSRKKFEEAQNRAGSFSKSPSPAASAISRSVSVTSVRSQKSSSPELYGKSALSSTTTTEVQKSVNYNLSRSVSTSKSPSPTVQRTGTPPVSLSKFQKSPSPISSFGKPAIVAMKSGTPPRTLVTKVVEEFVVPIQLIGREEPRETEIELRNADAETMTARPRSTADSGAEDLLGSAPSTPDILDDDVSEGAALDEAVERDPGAANGFAATKVAEEMPPASPQHARGERIIPIQIL